MRTVLTSAALVVAATACKGKDDKPAEPAPTPPPVTAAPADAAAPPIDAEPPIDAATPLSDTPLGPAPAVELRVIDDAGQPDAAAAVMKAMAGKPADTIAACGARTTYRGDLALQMTVLEEGKVETIPGGEGNPLHACVAEAAPTWKLPRQKAPLPLILSAKLSESEAARRWSVVDDGDDAAAAAAVWIAVAEKLGAQADRCTQGVDYRGDVAIELTLQPGGKVTDVGTAGGPPELEACVKKVVSGWKLPTERTEPLPLVLRLRVGT